jgi:hypothetical protein
MGGHKLTGLQTANDPTDAASKEYVDDADRFVGANMLGRYIFLIDQNGRKKYFSVRARKNIDLDDELKLEIKNNIKDSAGNQFVADSGDIRITVLGNLELMPYPDKDLGILRLSGRPIHIDISPTVVRAPWTIVLSAKPGDSPPRLDNRTSIQFIRHSGGLKQYLIIEWIGNRIFQYGMVGNIDRGHYLPLTDVNVFNNVADSSKINSIAFTYERGSLTSFLNGEKKKSKAVDLNDYFFHEILVGIKDIGILSVYDRALSKQEIIQHFVDNHVENWTDDEVMI